MSDTIDIETVQFQISQLPIVSKVELLDRELPCIEFQIGDEAEYPSGRVPRSRLVFTEDGKTIRDGTVRMPVHKRQFTGSDNSLAKRVNEQMKVSVIDSVMHIYFIGPNPIENSAPDHANITPQTAIQVLRFLNSSEPPHINLPQEVVEKFRD